MLFISQLEWSCRFSLISCVYVMSVVYWLCHAKPTLRTLGNDIYFFLWMTSDLSLFNIFAPMLARQISFLKCSYLVSISRLCLTYKRFSVFLLLLFSGSVHIRSGLVALERFLGDEMISFGRGIKPDCDSLYPHAPKQPSSLSAWLTLRKLSGEFPGVEPDRGPVLTWVNLSWGLPSWPSHALSAPTPGGFAHIFRL